MRLTEQPTLANEIVGSCFSYTLGARMDPKEKSSENAATMPPGTKIGVYFEGGDSGMTTLKIKYYAGELVKLNDDGYLSLVVNGQAHRIPISRVCQIFSIVWLGLAAIGSQKGVTGVAAWF